MKLKQRLKSDKKFRLKFVIIVVLLVGMGLSNSPDKKTWSAQSDCNQANSRSGDWCDWKPEYEKEIEGDYCMKHGPTDSSADKDTCLRHRCKVARQTETGFPQGRDTYGCFDCVPNGLWANKRESCCSNEGTLDSSIYSHYQFFCLPEPSEGRCSSGETTISNMVRSMFPSIEDCKTGYYIGLFVGGMMLMMMMGAMF